MKKVIFSSAVFFLSLPLIFSQYSFNSNQIFPKLPKDSILQCLKDDIKPDIDFGDGWYLIDNSDGRYGPDFTWESFYATDFATFEKKLIRLIEQKIDPEIRILKDSTREFFVARNGNYTCSFKKAGVTSIDGSLCTGYVLNESDSLEWVIFDSKLESFIFLNFIYSFGFHETTGDVGYITTDKGVWDYFEGVLRFRPFYELYLRNISLNPWSVEIVREEHDNKPYYFLRSVFEDVILNY